MADDEPIGKVTAFVVTPEDRCRLLVFDHPEAGTQLPAGTVEAGESFIDAARREVLEETGVSVHGPARELGRLRTESRTLGYTTRHTFAETCDRSAVRPLRPGLPLRIMEWDGATVRYVRESKDLRTGRFTLREAGRLPTGSVTNCVERIFVSLTHYGPIETAPRQKHADGHDFRPRWVALGGDVRLYREQQAWFDLFRDELAALQ